jgi:hypothetical protein
MKWLRQDQSFDFFLIALALTIALSLALLLGAERRADREQRRVQAAASQLQRLHSSVPFPNEENLRQTKAQTESYRSSLRALELELKSRTASGPLLQPSEFQALLRQTVTSVVEHAAASRVQLPENFQLGFDEYASSLPNRQAAPELEPQLRGLKWIVDTIIEAHVDSLSRFTRGRLIEENTAPSAALISPLHAPGRKSTRAVAEWVDVDFSSLDIGFSCSPAVARRILNQIAAARGQFYIIRTLQVRNEADKGPRRGTPAEMSSPSANPGPATPQTPQNISFIVGTEHIKVDARIEIVRFNFPGEGR